MNTIRIIVSFTFAALIVKIFIRAINDPEISGDGRTILLVGGMLLIIEFIKAIEGKWNRKGE